MHTMAILKEKNPSNKNKNTDSIKFLILKIIIFTHFLKYHKIQVFAMCIFLPLETLFKIVIYAVYLVMIHKLWYVKGQLFPHCVKTRQWQLCFRSMGCIGPGQSSKD